ncbi:MAG: hypothetical protein ABI442_18840 [Gemmatimonadaceae bacterium]
MTFSIELLPGEIVDPDTGSQSQYGEITLGSFQERFIALVGYWSAQRYASHWRDALMRVVEGEATSCLITSLHDPADSHLLFWWPLYRIGDVVQVQNSILLFEQLSAPFDPDNPFRFVPARTTVSEEGQPISEWEVPVSDIKTFLDRGAPAGA